ncbi:MAG: hypothetical protein Fues2KO_06690 [Fuerstiella sp.]
MNTKITPFQQFVHRSVFLVAVSVLAGCGDMPPEKDRETGGDYGPVTQDMLAGAALINRTGKDTRFDDLQWVFHEETFRITAGQNGLPPVLASQLLPDDLEATEITGRWAVKDDVITLTDMMADGVQLDQAPRTLRTMFTGVLRIQAGPQYVFSRQ